MLKIFTLQTFGLNHSFSIIVPCTCFYKQPSCKGSNIKNGLEVKQLAKQPSTLKTLMQKILVGLWVKNFTFSILSLLKLNFSTTVFGAT